MNNNSDKRNTENGGHRPAANAAHGTRQVPAARQTTPDGISRQVPVRRTPSKIEDMNATVNAPVKRPVPKAEDAGVTRQIPVQRPMPKAEGAGVTRQIPVQRPLPKAEDAGATRQIPVQRPLPKAEDSGATRQIPVQRPLPKAEDAGATRQIPVQRPLPKAEDSVAVNRTTVQRPAPKAPDPDATRQMAATGMGFSDSSTDGFGFDDSHAQYTADSSDKKQKDDEGNTIISVIKAVIYIVAVLVVSVSASIFIILVANDMYAFVKPEETVEITIPTGADIDDIAQILADNNIIKYPAIFKWNAAKNKDDGKFVAGQYTVASNLDYDDLLKAFKEQYDEGTTWITIPEGYTTDEIIDLLVEAGIGTKGRYIDVINNYQFDYWFVEEVDATDWEASGRIYRLDGYLFPDTYKFYNESSERAVIEKLLARFNVIYGKKYREAAKTMGLSTDTIITIASMIEKEAGMAADYHLVSSVFHNRLNSIYYPKLESDATVLYAIHHRNGERPTTVTPEHLKFDTPYNTYMYEGLPPGPIANPSASSINAALTPQQTDYYFFVSHGIKTYFARTKAEHDQNIAMIRDLIASATPAN